MHNFIAYKNDHILFSPVVIRGNYVPVITSLESWLTPEGLILPLHPGNYGTLEQLRHPNWTMPEEQLASSDCMLLAPSGRIYDISFDPTCTSRMYFPSHGEHTWARSLSLGVEEKVIAALMLTNTLEEALALFAKTVRVHDQFYRVHHVPTLANWVKTELTKRQLEAQA